MKNVCTLALFIIISGCNSPRHIIKDPNVPFCIHNGDTTASCTYNDSSYTQEDTVNWIMLNPEDYAAWEEHYIEVKNQLEIICVTDPIPCEDL